MPRTKMNPGALNESELLTLEEAHKKLGRGFAPATVKVKIRKGELIQGIHYFRTKENSGPFKLYMPAMRKYIIDINS